MKSELGLGIVEENLYNKRSKKKKHSKNHSKSTDLDRIVNFASLDKRKLSSRPEEPNMEIMEEEEEAKEEKLDTQNYMSVMEADLEKEEHESEDEEEFFSRAHHSCSHSPTEKYITRRINSEIHHLATTNKHQFPRTSSFDFNTENTAPSSPQFSVKKNTWTPNYQKGWSSERVPLYTYLNKGKQLPSKWEDAERWIGSPVSVYGNGRSVLPSYYRRGSKSKSGPLWPRDSLVPCFDSGRVVNMKADSPFLAGVLVGDPHCYGHRLDSKEGSLLNSPKLMSRDTGRKISPTESNVSSLNKGSISSVAVSTDSVVDVEARVSKLEIREIEVDGQFTTTREEHDTSDRRLRNIIDWKNTNVDNTSGVQAIDTYLSKDNRDEAKIGAWRNLQKAKAEEAIRKLELKLEKERAASVHKILNKLRSAEKKAEKMRSTVRSGQQNQHRPIIKKASFHNRFGHLNFIKSCFVSH